jgi:hypothetical protein
MKFKFLKIVLTGLIVLASASIKIVNAAPIYTVFEWEATCYDCKGVLGEDNGNNYTTINATLTLQYLDTLSDDWWGPTNFVSFTYTADSDHVFDFEIDGYVDTIDSAYGTVANEDSLAIYVNWTANANEIEKGNKYTEGQTFIYAFNSSYNAAGNPDEWDVSRQSGGIGEVPAELDFGNTFESETAPPINASAPSSILILALGLMGLSFRRSKKQNFPEEPKERDIS